MEKKETYYSRNRAKILERQKEYNQSHAEEQKRYYKEWYEKNKVELNRRRVEQMRAKRALVPRVKKEKKVKEKKEKPVLPIFVPEPEPEPVMITYTESDFTVRWD